MSANTAAMLVAPSSPLVVQPRRLPIPGPDQLLIQVKAIAINPADWKMQESKKGEPCVLGSDVAGLIESIGPSSQAFPSGNWQVGNRVAAFAGGAWSGSCDEGAFQKFVIVPASSTTLLPAGISFESAATLPMAAATASSALWETLELPRPDAKYSSMQPLKRSGILIYGASAAIGLLAVQMASKQGLTVFAVASSKHKEYICSLGAQYYIDRDDPDLVEAVALAVKEAALDGPLLLGLDAVSGPDSLTKAVAIMEKCAGTLIHPQAPRRPAKLAITLAWPSDLPRPISDVLLVERTSASHFHINHANASWLFNHYLQQGLETASIIPAPPVRIAGYGLESINEALQVCKRGVSCQKLVVRV